MVCREERLFFEGLQVRCQGWLGQGDLAFALAVFCRLFSHPRATVRRHLRRGPRLEFERACGWLVHAEPAGALRALAAAVRPLAGGS